MKYALLIYGNDTEWESRSDEEKQAIYGEYAQVSESPGIFGGSELQPGDTATTVRSQNGETLTTDGPFTETKEVLGGFFLLDADEPRRRDRGRSADPGGAHGRGRGAPAGGAP